MKRHDEGPLERGNPQEPNALAGEVQGVQTRSGDSRLGWIDTRTLGLAHWRI